MRRVKPVNDKVVLIDPTKSPSDAGLLIPPSEFDIIEAKVLSYPKGSFVSEWSTDESGECYILSWRLGEV